MFAINNKSNIFKTILHKSPFFIVNIFKKNKSHILFKDFMDIYLKAQLPRWKPSTIKAYETFYYSFSYFNLYFLDKITPLIIQEWQNKLLQRKNHHNTNKNISMSYIYTLNSRLEYMFNFAIKFYELNSNPVTIAGKVGNKNTTKTIWTPDNFRNYISSEYNPKYKLLFELLYYSGARIGEILALTLDDIDSDNNLIIINKTFLRINREDVISSPKTPSGNRSVTLPSWLVENLIQYGKNNYLKDDPTHRIFHHTTHAPAGFHFRKVSRECGNEIIRVHDLRHSHASLLIEQGFDVVTIAKRLGHSDSSMVIKVYGHMFPKKQIEIQEHLEDLISY